MVALSLLGLFEAAASAASPWPPPARAGDSPTRCAGVRCCRTQRHKTHSTASASDVTVAYAWHPWSGQSVRAHEVVEKASGSWARCSLAGADLVRLREIPTWMLDASVCRSMRKSAAPVAALSALAALRALLSEAMASAAAGPPAEAIASPAHKRGDRHATPQPPASEPGAPTRSLPGAPAACRRGGAAVGRPAGTGQARGDGADGPAADGPHRRRGAQGRGRRR